MVQLTRLDPVGTFQAARQNALTIERQGQQISSENALSPIRQETAQLDLARAKRSDAQSQVTQSNKTMNQVANALISLPENQWASAIQTLNPQLEDLGIPPLPAEGLTLERLQEVAATTKGFIDDPSSLGVASQTRASLLKDIESALDENGNFDPKKADATALSAAGELGLIAKAGTLSKDERIVETGKTQDIADSVATIAGQKKFAELSGSSRAKVIDKGFDAIQGIDKNIRNIDRAIEALNAGAGTGAIESRFFPSIKAASVALDQIQSELALDVVGATTFGALSAGELALARDVALPTKLDGPDLLTFLEDKKEAQLKLRSYYEEQIDFIDQGGTVAGFLRNKRRESKESQAAEEVQTGEVETSQKEGGQLMIDAQGNRAMVFPDGTFEEVQ